MVPSAENWAGAVKAWSSHSLVCWICCHGFCLPKSCLPGIFNFTFFKALFRRQLTFRVDSDSDFYVYFIHDFVFCRDVTVTNNSDNEYLERLTCTGPKRLHVL